MDSITKKFKFFSLQRAEVDRKKGNYPLQYIVPYGPEHENETSAEAWLQKNPDADKKFILLPLYSID